MPMDFLILYLRCKTNTMIQSLRHLLFLTIILLLSPPSLYSQCSFPFTENFSSGTAGQNESPRANSLAFNCLTYEVNGNGGIALEDVPWMGFTGLQNFSGLMVVGDWQWFGDATNGVSSFTMRATNNTNDFKLNALDWAVPNGGPPTVFTITGYNNGTQTAQVTGVNVANTVAAIYGAGTTNETSATYIGPGDGSGDALHLVFSGTGWQNIDAIVFSSTGNDITMALDNISLSPPVSAACTQLVEADMPASTTGPFTKTIESQTFTFTPALNSYVGMADEVPGFEGLYAYDYDTPAGTEIAISAPAGYSFDFNSFRYASNNDPLVNTLTLTLTFVNGSTDTRTYSLSGGNTSHTFNTFTTAANDVISVKLVTDLLLYSNDFCITDVKPLTTLPLSLLSFTGTSIEQGVQLIWKTTEEVNTSSFGIQRSQRGNDFTAIAGIPSNAVSGNYTYTDHTAVNGQTYLYRLKMIDLNGHFTYSPTIQVRVNKNSSAGKFTLFPNPIVGNQVSLRANTSDLPAVRIAVRDISGRTWLNSTITKANGLYSFPVQQLRAGTYVLQVYSLQGALLQVEKFVK